MANEFLSQLGRRAPHIALAFLAARKGGPMALAALEGGMAQAQQRQEALARQAQLDEERRAAQAAQEARLANADTRADEQAEFQRKQAAIQTLWQAIQQQGETAADPVAAENALKGQASGLESFYGVPQGQLAGMVPNMAGPVGRGVRKDVSDLLANAERRLTKTNPEAEINDATVSFTWENATPRVQKWLVSQGHPEGQPFKPSQLQAVSAQPTITAPKATKDKRGFQRTEAMVGGRRAFVNYDPDTGTYSDESGAPVSGATPIPPQERTPVPNEFKDIITLRTQIRQEPEFKTTVEVRNGYDNVKVGARLSNAQGDLAIVNGMAKMLDPTGVVRPAEFNTVEEAQGFFQRLMNYPSKIAQGDRLHPDARAAFLAAAKDLYKQKQQPWQALLHEVYGPLAKRHGLSLDELVPKSYQTIQADEELSTAQPQQLAVGKKVRNKRTGEIGYVTGFTAEGKPILSPNPPK